MGATHASEVFYVFGTLDEQRPMRPNYDAADFAISKAMQEYWTNFAKTGNPDGTGLPAWPQYKVDTKQYLEFTDKGPVVGSGLRSAQCAVYSDTLQQAPAKTTTSAH